MRMPSIRFGSRNRKRLEEQFRLALEAAPTGMLMMDGTGKIVLVNARIEALFGYPREELLGQRIEMLVPERLRAHHPDLRDTFFRDPTARPMGAGRELFGLRRDGTEVPIEIGLNPLHTPEGDFVLSTIADIAERKRSDERFHLAIEAAPTGMLMIDRAGKMVLVNAQIEKLFGYPRAEAPRSAYRDAGPGTLPSASPGPARRLLSRPDDAAHGGWAGAVRPA